MLEVTTDVYHPQDAAPRENRILVDPDELQKVEKIIVPVFAFDNRSRKIFRSTKDIIIKTVTSLEFKPQKS